jgi:hypothetical protein
MCKYYVMWATIKREMDLLFDPAVILTDFLEPVITHFPQAVLF